MRFLRVLGRANARATITTAPTTPPPIPPAIPAARVVNVAGDEWDVIIGEAVLVAIGVVVAELVVEVAALVSVIEAPSMAARSARLK